LDEVLEVFFGEADGIETTAKKEAVEGVELGQHSRGVEISLGG